MSFVEFFPRFSNIQTFEDTLEGLDEIKDSKYPLILFDAPTVVGKLELPREIDSKDWILTDCYILECIRDIRPKTPIIVTHLSFKEYTQPQAIERYSSAGATNFVNLSEVSPTGASLTELLKQYLK